MWPQSGSSRSISLPLQSAKQMEQQALSAESFKWWCFVSEQRSFGQVNRVASSSPISTTMNGGSSVGWWWWLFRCDMVADGGWCALVQKYEARVIVVIRRRIPTETPMPQPKPPMFWEPRKPPELLVAFILQRRRNGERRPAGWICCLESHWCGKGQWLFGGGMMGEKSTMACGVN